MSFYVLSQQNNIKAYAAPDANCNMKPERYNALEKWE
jgi:hypothetical protein